MKPKYVSWFVKKHGPQIHLFHATITQTATSFSENMFVQNFNNNSIQKLNYPTHTIHPNKHKRIFLWK